MIRRVGMMRRIGVQKADGRNGKGKACIKFGL